MVKIQLKSGEIKEVTRNEAHDLIDRGLAVLYIPKPEYKGRPMTASDASTTPGNDEGGGMYHNRQMRGVGGNRTL